MEMLTHSVGYRDSTMFALNIEQLLKTASIVDRLPPKLGNKQLAPYYYGTKNKRSWHCQDNYWEIQTWL